MKNKSLFFCFITSFFCWLLPFVCRFFFVEFPKIEVEQMEQITTHTNSIDVEAIHFLLSGDNKSAFIAIFGNNIRGCILNILGGVTLGLGSLINLLYNGFSFADMVVSFSQTMSMNTILKVTLPHSFELIGFWLSGAIGFYIAWNIIQFMRGKESFSISFYKQVGICSLGIFIIILAAAYVESYISIKYISS